MDAQPTLRDTLTTAFETHVEAPAVDAKTDVKSVETAEKPPVKFDRDEQGRFVEKKEEKQETKEVKAKSETPIAQAYVPPKRPSTWKPELEDHWGKLPKEVHEEIARREADYSKGVSTYKSEWDRAKPVLEALHAHQQTMQQLNITPEKFVAGLAATDQTLRYGSEEQKLAAFAQFAQDYGVPIHKLLVQGEDGKVYQNQQYYRAQQQQQPAGLTAQDVDKIVAQRMQDMAWQNAISTFSQAKDKDGHPLYPHFSSAEVRKSMDGLLRAGLAQDLPSAYTAALKLPQHSSILEAEQKQLRDAEEAEKARKAQEDAKRARAQTVSTKSQTPTAMTSENKRGKGLRELLSEGLDEQAGRV